MVVIVINDGKHKNDYNNSVNNHSNRSKIIKHDYGNKNNNIIISIIS